MLFVRLTDGTSFFWSVGEIKPTVDPLAIVYIRASGPELEHLQARVPEGLRMPTGSVIGHWIGDLAGTVWMNV